MRISKAHYGKYMSRTSLFLLLFLSIYSSTDAARPKKTSCLLRTACSAIPKGPATIYIHGTLFQSPFVSKAIHHGLHRYSSKNCPPSSSEYIDRALFISNPKEFPEEHFYKFYWSGKLHSEDRRKAAEDLFSALEKSKGPITLIAHSHGCNVALLLGEIARSKNKTDVLVDRLILLAPPVQEATCKQVNSPIFRRVYSLYSTADVAQIVAPQGWFMSSHACNQFFSERTFPACPKLLQARVLLRGQSPGHQDFIQPRFIKQVSKIISVLDEAADSLKENCCINIPFHSKEPYILKKPYTYCPRKEHRCSCVRKVAVSSS